jgi:hypothetical protein
MYSDYQLISLITGVVMYETINFLSQNWDTIGLIITNIAAILSPQLKLFNKGK